MPELTDFQAAERLGVPHATLVTWLDALPIPRTEAGLDEAALEVLEAVRLMKAFDHGDQTIRRHLETELAPELAFAPAAVVAPPVSETPVTDAFPGLDLVALIGAVTDALEPLQRRIVELGDEKARAHAAISREVGKLEAESAHLRTDHARLATDLAAAREREQRLEELLTAAHNRIVALEFAAVYRWWNPLTWVR